MALNATGPISLGGSTTGQSVNLELGKSATAQISMGDAAVRSLIGVSSGAVAMPTNFWGKSKGFTYTGTMTQGTAVDGSFTYYGFSRGNFGSLSPDDTTITTLQKFYTGSQWFLSVNFAVPAGTPQNFWTTLTIGGTFSINSSSASAFLNGNTWEFANTNPSVLTGSGTLSVVFS